MSFNVSHQIKTMENKISKKLSNIETSNRNYIKIQKFLNNKLKQLNKMLNNLEESKK